MPAGSSSVRSARSFGRTGGSGESTCPGRMGPEVVAICRRYAELRMQLLPYLYTLAWYAHTRGEPLMRPLVYHYPDDPAGWELGSQYLLSPDLLVAPVTRPGATHWPV